METSQRKSSIILPEAIIFEIFSWLPIKSLRRSRCVSRFCNALVSDSYFIKIHESRNNELVALIVEGNKEKFYNIELGQQCIASNFRVNKLDSVDWDYRCAYAKGLLCLWSTDLLLPAVILDLITRQTRIIPCLNSDIKDDCACDCHYSMGFDQDKGRHKILLTQVFKDRMKPMKNWVFSLGVPGESWREVDSIAYIRPLFKGGVDINGVVYFFCYYCSLDRCHTVIVGFDFSCEEFKIISSLWNDHVDSHDCTYNLKLVEVEGNLAAIDYSSAWHGGTQATVWILQCGALDDHQKENQWVHQEFVAKEEEFCINAENNIVFANKSWYKPNLIFLFDLKKQSWRVIDEILGLASKNDKIIGMYRSTSIHLEVSANRVEVMIFGVDFLQMHTNVSNEFLCTSNHWNQANTRKNPKFPSLAARNSCPVVTGFPDNVNTWRSARNSCPAVTDEESFQLLENRVFSSNSRCPEDLVAHGKSIAKQCSGVPLAVVVIAGALRGCTTKKEWKSIEDNVGQYLINEDEPESSLKFVEISYSHLPEDMKACFLYCGAFPRNYEIPAWKLIRLWISEGLINPKLRGSLEDIAEDYLNKLVNRNLVMEMQKRADGQVKTCRLHDMFHQFCRMEAHNEGLLHEVCERAGQSEIDIPDLDTSRRVCIQPSLLEAFISKRPSAEHVRSFLCFSTEQKGSEQLSNIRLLHKAFPLARVLDAECLKFSFSRNFSELFHLRYIAISSSHNTLPEFFGKFWHLQTLILNTKASTIEIKVDILNMLRLRHLHTNVPALLQSPATQTTDEPSCLQTLSKVAPGSCREDVLARACNLRKVSVEGKMADFFETNKGEFSNFKKIKSLEKLKLLNDISSSMTKALQLPPAFLEFLGRLKKLTLSNTRFAWSDAIKLGQLECLEVLKLKENAFVGTTWDSEGFRRLKVLWIQRADFRTWKASKDTFQRLKRLVLISCHNLEAVPSELAGVSSLQEMTLEYTKKANKSAKAIEGEKKEMQERMQKPAESKSGARTRALEISKFTLTIFPREGAEF